MLYEVIRLIAEGAKPSRRLYYSRAVRARALGLGLGGYLRVASLDTYSLCVPVCVNGICWYEAEKGEKEKKSWKITPPISLSGRKLR